MIQNISCEFTVPRSEVDWMREGASRGVRNENPHKTTKQLSSTNLIFSLRNEHETVLLFRSGCYRICLIFCHRFSSAPEWEHKPQTTSSKCLRLALLFQRPPPPPSLPSPLSLPLDSRNPPFIMWRTVGKLFPATINFSFVTSSAPQSWKSGLSDGTQKPSPPSPKKAIIRSS